ncbi:hypothetical protein C8A00DRAFT_31142 [Chaetomidium leptoderma]|uniref:Uncharacterized protein n=1 Tax=Chaetomidium leptoderma TaxID=669021 RepID=A0AAN6VSC7_9PEZI|nr:hypothetical protein C8A00DRAFT_31142 [Chaetomidium leptoderma]
MPTFQYPPPNSANVYNKMDTVIVTYTSFHETAVLYAFCRPGHGDMVINQKVPGFNASVPVVLDFTSDTPCWFNLRTGTNSAGTDFVDGVNGALWNLIGQENQAGRKVYGLASDLDTVSSSSSTVSSILSSTSTVSSSSTTVSSISSSTSTVSSSSTTGSPPTAATSGSGSNSGAPNPNPSDSDTASSAPGGSGGLSAGASAGIGVGAAIGVLALAGGAFMLGRRRRRHDGQTTATTPGMGDNSMSLYRSNGGPPPPSSYGGYSGGGGGDGRLPAEMGQYSHSAHPDVPDALKWQYGGELNGVNSPAEIYSASTPTEAKTGRMYH